MSGVHGAPPPSTTKLAVCTEGGFQLEYYMFATGLDIREKLADFQACLDEVVPNREAYTVLRVDQYGVPQQNAPIQALATCMFRIFAQAGSAEALSTLPRAIGGYGLGGYCGQHGCMDFRMVSRVCQPNNGYTLLTM